MSPQGTTGRRNKRDDKLGALSIRPKIPVISVGTSKTSNGTDDLSLFPPEYSEPALKVLVISVGRTEMSLAQLFCILLTKTITKRAVAWVESVQPEWTVSLGTWKFPHFSRFANAATRPCLIFSRLPLLATQKVIVSDWGRGSCIEGLVTWVLHHAEEGRAVLPVKWRETNCLTVSI